MPHHHTQSESRRNTTQAHSQEASEDNEKLDQLVKQLRSLYRSYHLEWIEHCEAIDRLRLRLNHKKRPTLTPVSATIDLSAGLPANDSIGILSASSTSAGIASLTASGRTTRRTANFSTFGIGDAVTDAQFDLVLAQLGTADEKDPNIRAMKTTAPIPDMALLPSDRQISCSDHESDMLVTDPISFYELNQPEAKITNLSRHHSIKSADVWTPQEQDAFEKAYAAQPKQFGWIASQVRTKTRGECVLHYYRTKLDFKYRNLHSPPQTVAEGKTRELRGRRSRRGPLNKTQVDSPTDSLKPNIKTPSDAIPTADEPEEDSTEPAIHPSNFTRKTDITQQSSLSEQPQKSCLNTNLVQPPFDASPSNHPVDTDGFNLNIACSSIPDAPPTSQPPPVATQNNPITSPLTHNQSPKNSTSSTAFNTPISNDNDTPSFEPQSRHPTSSVFHSSKVDEQSSSLVPDSSSLMPDSSKWIPRDFKSPSLDLQDSFPHPIHPSDSTTIERAESSSMEIDQPLKSEIFSEPSKPAPVSVKSSMQIKNLLNDDPVDPSASLSNMDANSWFGNDSIEHSPSRENSPFEPLPSTRHKLPPLNTLPMEQVYLPPLREYNHFPRPLSQPLSQPSSHPLPRPLSRPLSRPSSQLTFSQPSSSRLPPMSSQQPAQNMFKQTVPIDYHTQHVDGVMADEQFADPPSPLVSPATGHQPIGNPSQKHHNAHLNYEPAKSTHPQSLVSHQTKYERSFLVQDRPNMPDYYSHKLPLSSNPHISSQAHVQPPTHMPPSQPASQVPPHSTSQSYLHNPYQSPHHSTHPHGSSQFGSHASLQHMSASQLHSSSSTQPNTPQFPPMHSPPIGTHFTRLPPLPPTNNTARHSSENIQHTTNHYIWPTPINMNHQVNYSISHPSSDRGASSTAWKHLPSSIHHHHHHHPSHSQDHYLASSSSSASASNSATAAGLPPSHHQLKTRHRSSSSASRQ